MNATARSLGMTRTRYTDPSGYDDATVSTAADQLRIVDRAMRLPAFASIVATPSATLPVAGTVHNTNTLLGRDGFVGVKTGSDARPAAASRSGRSAGRRQADDDHRRRAGPARPRPDRRRASQPQTRWSTASPAAELEPGSAQQLPAPGAPPRTRTRQRTGVDPHSTQGGTLEENTLAAGRPWHGRHCCRDRRGLWRRTEQQRHEHCRRSRHQQQHHDGRAHRHRQSHEHDQRPREGREVRGVHARQRRQRLPGSERVRSNFPSYGVSVTPTVWTERDDRVQGPGSHRAPGSAKLTPDTAIRRRSDSPSASASTACRTSRTPSTASPSSTQRRSRPSNKPGGMTILNAATHTCGHLIAQQDGEQVVSRKTSAMVAAAMVTVSAGCGSTGGNHAAATAGTAGSGATARRRLVRRR